MRRSRKMSKSGLRRTGRGAKLRSPMSGFRIKGRGKRKR